MMMNINNSIGSSLFGYLETKAAIKLLLYATLVAFLSINGQGEYIAVLNIIISIFFIFHNRAIALGIIIINGPLLSIFATGFMQIISYVPFIVYSLYLYFLKGLANGSFKLLFFSLLIVSISFVIGYSPDLINYLLQIICLAMCFSTYLMFSQQDVPIIIWSYICCAIVIIVYVFSGDLEVLAYQGRLGYGGGSKELALVCTIPLALSLFSIILDRSVFENRKSLFYKALTVLQIPIYLMVIFATGARGVLLGMGVGVSLLLFIQGVKVKKTIIFFFIFAIAFILFDYVSKMDMFRMERFLAFEEYESGNGRTEIWDHYISKMDSMGILTTLFGTGPGNIERISNIGYYAHSTFLDYYFCYGLFGFIFLCVFEFKSLKFIYSKTNVVPFLLTVTYILTNLTHGTAANTFFFMFQALMMAYFKPSNK